MFTRMLILTLMFTLAIPVATLTRPAETSSSSWSEVAVAAKGKKHNKAKKPKSSTVTRTVRGPITQTFTRSEPITVPNGAPGTTSGPASAYPSAIAVAGFTNGVITDVDLLLRDVTHSISEDVDILLSAPDGRRALVVSDVGRIFSVANIDLTLDDEAAASLPQTQLDSGVFRPTDISVGFQDFFAAPAPALDGSVALSTFDGANPNGTWQLFVMDDASGDVGDISGWALRITAEVDAGQVEEQIPVSKDKKHKKGKGQGKRRR